MGWKNTGCFRARHNGLGVFTVGYHTSRGLPILCVDQMLCSAEHGVYPGPKKRIEKFSRRWHIAHASLAAFTILPGIK